MYRYIGATPITHKNYDYRVNLTKNIDYELENESFRGRSKNGPKEVFSRNRKITFKELILQIILFKSSIQRDLDRFYKELSNSDFNIRKVTKGAFTQARAKLNPWAFKRLTEVAVDTFYNEAEYYIWYDKRVLAVDGSTLVLPNHPSTIEEFGSHCFGPKGDSPRCVARTSMLYDVLNHLTIDAQIAPYTTSEKDMLLEHLAKVKKGDLLLLDRGYPCYWLFFLLRALDIDFCMRMKADWWLKVKEFTEGVLQQNLVRFKLPKSDHERLKEYSYLFEQELEFRLIRVKLEDGSDEILCTSLLDMERYEAHNFEQLYHYRWNEEEAYKILKNRIEIEAFSGKTAIAIKQDYFAKVFLMTLTAAYAHPIEDKVIKEYKADKNRKFSQKINRTNAVATTQSILISAFIKKMFIQSIYAFDNLVGKTRELIRTGRKNIRKSRTRRAYSINYKRL